MSGPPRVRCLDEVLVEALHDGRLGEREAASVERHLARCADCRAHRTFLRGLTASLRKDDEPPRLEHQRLRVALLRGAAHPQRPSDASRRKLLSAAAALAAALVVTATWAIARRDDGPATPPSGSSSASPPSAPSPATTSPRADEPRAAALDAEPSPSASAAERAAPPDATPPRTTAPRRIAPSSPAAIASPPRVPPPPRAAEPSPREPAPAPPVDSASREFAEAVEAIGRGDYDAGATGLGRFSSAHPDDARVDESDYLVAIALERAGRPDEAAAAALRYLEAHPRGAHRREAAILARRRSAP